MAPFEFGRKLIYPTSPNVEGRHLALGVFQPASGSSFLLRNIVCNCLQALSPTFVKYTQKTVSLNQRNLRRGKEILLVATIQISSVQILVFESRKFRSGQTNIVKISKKKFLWYDEVNFCVGVAIGTMLNTLNQGKAFLGVR